MSRYAELQDVRISGFMVLCFLALAQFLLHLWTNGNYGMFRDEFYYIACSDHLDWGYVDHPPLSIALLSLSRALFGDSVRAVRLLPALAGVLSIFLAVLMARELGGGRFAQITAGLCVMLVPSYLVITGFFSMNAFDLLFWSLVFYLLLRIINTENQKLWLLVGLLLGLGLLNKISVLILGFCLFVALILTPQRKYLLGKHIWIGSAVAFLLFFPHVLWQVAHDWPTLEFINNAKQYKIAEFSPLQFFAAQILSLNPFYSPIWLAGLIWLLAGKEGRRYRLFAFIYITALIVFMLQKSKTYYLVFAYPVLLAAGARVIESLVCRFRWRWIKPVPVAYILIGGLLLLPFGVPVLPVDTFMAYQSFTGINAPADEKSFKSAILPQYFGDRFGWEEMARRVASVYRKLPPAEQANCVILAANYGEAGAMDYYRARYGLPPVICTHNNYHLWGPGDAEGAVVISIAISYDELADIFEEVHPAATVISAYAMPYESNLTVHVCRRLKLPLEEIWQRAKSFV